MRITLKHIIIAWVLLILVLAGLMFKTYSKLRPETLVSLLSTQIQKNFPGSIIDVGDMSYGLSVDFNLTLTNLSIIRGDVTLAKIDEIELKIPWWLLLTNHGNAQVNLNGLDILIDRDHQQKIASGQTKSSAINISLPPYLSEAKFTLRAKDISIRDLKSSSRVFVISKFLIREFQPEKKSAFELNIPISIKQKETRFVSDLWLFGDVIRNQKSWEFNYRGEFRTKEDLDKIHLEDLVVDGKAFFEPANNKTSSDFNLYVEKDLIGVGKASAALDLFSLKVNFTKLPLTYLSFIHDGSNEQSITNTNEKASGLLEFEKNLNTANIALSGKFNFIGDLKFSDEYSIPGKWQINFKDYRMELSFISPLGDASFFRRSVYDSESDLFSQYSEELGFSGLQLDKVIRFVKPLTDISQVNSSSYFTTTIVCKKCLVGENKLDGVFKYGITPDRRYYHGEMKGDNNSLTLNYVNNTQEINFEAIFKNFIWNSGYSFLSPYFSADKAIINGKLQGKWVNLWREGTWTVDLGVHDLQNAQGDFNSFIDKATSIFELRSSDFNKQVLKLTGKNGKWSFNSVILEKEKVVRINGVLNPNQKSFLTLSYPKDRKLKSIKKEVNGPFWIEGE